MDSMTQQTQRPNDPTTQRLCTRCILPETFPNTRFDSDGVCNHCRQEESALAKSSAKKAEYRQKLDDLIAASRDKAPAYDVIMAYSGGKDSSYTLKLLKERYKLRIITLTLDNHFVSPTAWDNIHTVVDSLGTDHVSFRPSWALMKKLFRLTAQEDIFSPATLLRASAMCTACIGIVKSLVLKTALEMSIPLVAFGWSPGQAPIQSAIMKTNPSLIRQNQKALTIGLSSHLDSPLISYLLPPAYYDLYKDHFPYNIHPLAFFDYDEEKIMAELESIGWKQPTNTDTNSTNCLLNAFANQCHLDRHKFHPYVFEIANMVRQGVMSREDGLEKIYSPQNPDQVAYAKNKLDL
jgi:tRNA(Ile)-lysidine synthase TilS/MesJ